MISLATLEEYNKLYYDKKILEQVYQELLQLGFQFDENTSLVDKSI